MIELLAPGGSKESIETAAYYGADAVYFGVGSFNARAGADNLKLSQIEEIMDFLHARAVKGYLALNVLLKDNELDEALDLARQAMKAGVDSVIVQDLGLASLIRETLPDMQLHASTQMTITDEYSLARASELGINRVVLPRELNSESISRLTNYADTLNIETEVFVHGALCVAYSGQCLISGIKRARSANRGQCSQPCRLAYSIDEYQRPNSISSNCDKPESFRPLISPKDQSLIEYLPELITAGVSSLKIEGRMRSVEYVAMTVSEYRRAIDQYYAGRKITPDQKQLLTAFNRGGEFTDRHYTGKRDNCYVTGSYPGSYGVYLGHVDAVIPQRGILQIKLADKQSLLPIRGDILSIRSDYRETASAPIGVIEKGSATVMVKAFHPDVLKRIKIGEQVYQMSDTARLIDLRNKAQKKIPIEMYFETYEAAPEDSMSEKDSISSLVAENRQSVRLKLKILSGVLTGIEAVIARSIVASEHALSEDRIRQQLAKTGATQFVASRIDIKYCDHSGAGISISELNRLRRDAITHLEQIMIDSFKTTSSSQRLSDASPTFVNEKKTTVDASFANNESHKQSRDRLTRIDVWYQRLPDDPAETACGADCYILPLWPLANNEGAKWIRSLKQSEPDSKIIVWLPPAQQNAISLWTNDTVRLLVDNEIDGICSSSPGAALQAGDKLLLQLDSGLNVTNIRAAKMALSKNPEALAFSPELTASQVLEIVSGLKGSFDTSRLTLPVYGRRRLMSSVYCPVGHNIPGCRKCYQQQTDSISDNAKLYDLCDQSKQRMILQTHPLFCTVDILDNSLLLDTDMIQTPWPVRTAWRLHMLDENYQERKQLIQSFRDLDLDEPLNYEDRILAIKRLTHTIADRITEGSVARRRIIYE